MKALPTLRITLGIFGFSMLPMVATAEEFLTISDNQGKQVEVSPVSTDGKNFTFARKADSKRFTIQLEDLDTVSQKEVKLWFKEGKHLASEYEIDVNVRDDDSGDTIVRGNFKRGFVSRDIESLTFKPRVTISNKSLGQSTKPAEVCVMTVFKVASAPKVNRVYSIQYFDLPELGSTKNHVEQLPETGGRFNEYRSPEYVGYIVLLTDPNTKEVLAVEAEPASLVGDDPSKLVGLKRGGVIKE